MSTDTDPEIVLRRFFEAFNHQDIGALEELVTEDFHFHVVWSASLSAPMPREAALKLLSATCQGTGLFSSFTIRVPDLIVHSYDDGAGAAAEYQSDAVWHESGNAYANSYIGLFQFRGARISEWREYFNPNVVIASRAGTAS